MKYILLVSCSISSPLASDFSKGQFSCKPTASKSEHPTRILIFCLKPFPQTLGAQSSCKYGRPTVQCSESPGKNQQWMRDKCSTSLSQRNSWGNMHMVPQKVELQLPERGSSSVMHPILAFLLPAFLTLPTLIFPMNYLHPCPYLRLCFRAYGEPFGWKSYTFAQHFTLKSSNPIVCFKILNCHLIFDIDLKA